MKLVKALLWAPLPGRLQCLLAREHEPWWTLEGRKCRRCGKWLTDVLAGR